MPTYAIGDVQGCHDELRALLAQIAFEPARDRLWFVGDLVNRGPKSRAVLRLVKDLGPAAITVLGNHDLHLLCVYEGFAKFRRDDTFSDVLDAPDADDLVAWLRMQPMMHVEGGHALVHAGLLPDWSIDTALVRAREVEAALRAVPYREFLAHLYGSRPVQWSDALTGWDRLRVIVNAMTRMRYCTPAGVMEFHAKGTDAPAGLVPWHETRHDVREHTIVCGHWSMQGLKISDRLIALDTGCVWGGALTAIRLEDRRVFQVACAGYQVPGTG